MTGSEFDRKVAIVTGGASGIGFAIARNLAVMGARVAICDIAGADAAATRLADDRHAAIGIDTDVADERSVQNAVDQTLAAFGSIDVLINNAGLFTTITRASLDQLPITEWRRVLDVNVTGTFLFSRAVWEPLRRAGARPSSGCARVAARSDAGRHRGSGVVPVRRRRSLYHRSDAGGRWGRRDALSRLS